MRTIYTVHVDGHWRYHGINRSDALEAVYCAVRNGERNVKVQEQVWPELPV